MSSMMGREGRPRHLSYLKRVFDNLEKARAEDGQVGGLLNESDAPLRYRDPWELSPTGDFRTAALSAIDEAKYVLGAVSNLTDGVAYEIGYAIGRKRPLSLVWFSNQGPVTMPFYSTSLPSLLQKHQTVELTNASLLEKFRYLHVRLLDLEGRKRCPKLETDQECEYLADIAATKSRNRPRILLAFQSRHREQRDWMRTVALEAGYQCIELGSGPHDEGVLCSGCWSLQSSEAVVVDVTPNRNQTDPVMYGDAKNAMVVAGMARGLGLPTLHLYDEDHEMQSMVDGQVGSWGRQFQRDLSMRWSDFTSALKKTGARGVT